MFQKIAKHRANDASNDVHRPPLPAAASPRPLIPARPVFSSTPTKALAPGNSDCANIIILLLSLSSSSNAKTGQRVQLRHACCKAWWWLGYLGWHTCQRWIRSRAVRAGEISSSSSSSSSNLIFQVQLEQTKVTEQHGVEREVLNWECDYPLRPGNVRKAHERHEGDVLFLLCHDVQRTAK